MNKRTSYSFLKVAILALFMIFLTGSSISSKAFAATAARPATPVITGMHDTANGARIAWTLVAEADGYQIRFSEKSDLTDYTTVYAGKLIGKRTLTLPSASKDYYVKVRAFRKNEFGKKVYSKWSNIIEILGWNDSWEFASSSKIHKSHPVIFFANGPESDSPTICVNAGHGTPNGNQVRTNCHPDGTAKVTGGSTAAGEKTAAAVSSGTTMLDGTPEAVINLGVAMLFKEELLARGYNVLMIRENNEQYIDNVARTVYANNYADCHIALHFDSTTDDRGAFYIGVPDISSYKKMYPVSKMYESHNKLGKTLLDALKNGGVKIRGAGNIPLDLTQTSYSTVPSIDMELGDRASSHTEKDYRKLALALADGVDTFFR